jgi:hypothetical protein
MEHRILDFPRLFSMNNHSGNPLVAPRPGNAEQDSARDLVVRMSRFVFRMLARVFDLPIDD